MSYGTYKGKSLRPGGGGAFSRFVDRLEVKGKSAASAKAIAAGVGRKKYGKRRFAAMGRAGRRRARLAAMKRMSD